MGIGRHRRTRPADGNKRPCQGAGGGAGPRADVWAGRSADEAAHNLLGVGVPIRDLYCYLIHVVNVKVLGGELERQSMCHLKRAATGGNQAARRDSSVLTLTCA